MTKSKFSYPFPVLRNWADDVKGNYFPKASARLQTNSIHLRLSQLLPDNQSIADLVREQKAEVSVRVQCASTYYRNYYKTHGEELTLELEAFDLRDEVSIDTRIIATEELTHYAPAGMHPDYGDTEFKVARGDLVAEGRTLKFYASKDFDPLRAPISSIVRVVHREDLDDGDPFVVSLEEDKIHIGLPDAAWRGYKDVLELAPSSLHISLVLPALVEAIRQVNEQEQLDYRWAQRLRMILEERDIDTADPLSAAQILLRNPFVRATNALVERIEEIQ